MLFNQNPRWLNWWWIVQSFWYFVTLYQYNRSSSPVGNGLFMVIGNLHHLSNIHNFFYYYYIWSCIIYYTLIQTSPCFNHHNPSFLNKYPYIILPPMPSPQASCSSQDWSIKRLILCTLCYIHYITHTFLLHFMFISMMLWVHVFSAFMICCICPQISG